MHGHCESYGGRWAAGRHRRGRFGGYGFGGRHGMGGEMGPEDLRAGRMLAQGDLRLIALALIAQEPRHGYEIIKLVEEKTADWYSPSPGIVYPTLTYLEEAGYVTVSSEGSKKLYTITDDGRAYLAEQRDVADAILKRLAAVGERMARMRRRLGDDDESLPRSISGAFQDLSEAVRALLREDREAKGRIIDAIDRVASELRPK
ncbi:MAG: PadR family transcriptional regulator [Xanthobacteraceae bacterium]